MTAYERVCLARGKDRFTSVDFIKNTVRQYSGMIVRVAFHYVKRRDDAEDIMQDTFLELLQQPEFTDQEKLKAWLIRVTVNKSKNLLKSTKRRRTDPLEENYYRAQESIKLDELYELGEKDRELIYLYYYEGYSAREIAIMKNKKERAILMRLSRARDRLKILLEEE